MYFKGISMGLHGICSWAFMGFEWDCGANMIFIWDIRWDIFGRVFDIPSGASRAKPWPIDLTLVSQ